MLLVFLAACTSGPSKPGIPIIEEQVIREQIIKEQIIKEQEDYAAHARSYYAPPGTPEDPWGPYIREAAERFDVPELWIRTVMNRESGGKLYDKNGNFITSMPGAMGLMQIMPPAYDDLRLQYKLGSDPYAPHDNIIAGTAYIRQMYDIYGSPGFLAAYNYGPGNLDRYLRQNHPLPKETRDYVKAIGRKIAGIWPQHRSQADLMVARHDPTQKSIPDQDPTDTTSLNSTPPSETNQSVSAIWASRGFSPTPSSTLTVRPPPLSHHQQDTTLQVSSIPLAHPRATPRSATDITTTSSHNWSIQVGSYSTQKQANNIATRLRNTGGTLLNQTQITITPFHIGKHVLYRTRFTNLSQTQAQNACQRFKKINACIILSPHSHS